MRYILSMLLACISYTSWASKQDALDWQDWQPQAFAQAAAEGKFVLLDLEAVWCHWCHVMERESYQDNDIARVINNNFIAIKVDRERRPDVDETYMLATQLITQSGGWPNNVFMTPELKPFYGGTYFPPDQFMSVLELVRDNCGDDILAYADPV